VQRWQPSPGDLQPQCKVTAVRAVETAGNRPGRSLQVIDAQYGGLLADAASVLVVCRSWSLVGDTVREGGHTYDVRLERRGGSWRLGASRAAGATHPDRAPRPGRRPDRTASCRAP